MKVLLDKGAGVNMWNKSLCTVYMHCILFPESPIVNDNVCEETLHVQCMHVTLFNFYYKESILRVMHTCFTTKVKKNMHTA